MVYHWSLSDNKSPQVSRTLLSILADLSYAVVWIVSTHLLISKFSSPFTNPFIIIIIIIIIIWSKRSSVDGWRIFDSEF